MEDTYTGIYDVICSPDVPSRVCDSCSRLLAGGGRPSPVKPGPVRV